MLERKKIFCFEILPLKTPYVLNPLKWAVIQKFKYQKDRVDKELDRPKRRTVRHIKEKDCKTYQREGQLDSSKEIEKYRQTEQRERHKIKQTLNYPKQYKTNKGKLKLK